LKATAGAYSVRPDHLKEKKKRGLIRHYQPRPNLVSDLVSKPAILPVFSDSVDFLTFCRQQLTLFVVPWHGRGRRFDPDQVHQFLLKSKVSRNGALPAPCATRGKDDPRLSLQGRKSLHHCGTSFS
jgi:hypothetical protein